MREEKGRFIMLAYDFPPRVRSGTYRPARLARTMREAGREVVVVTASEWDDPRMLDPSLLGDWADGIRVKRVFSFSSFLLALEKALGKVGLAGVIYHPRKRMLVPDEQVLWATAALAAVLAMRPRDRDIVLTSSPPWSAHIAGLLLKRLCGVKWIADHRDPWTRNPHFRGKGPREAALQARIEAHCHSRADAILTASHTHAEELSRCFDLPDGKVVPLYTGYSAEDFDSVPGGRARRLLCSLAAGKAPGAPLAAEPFVILYAGSLYGDYFPGTFLEGLAAYFEEREEERGRVRVVFFLAHGMDRLREECARLGLLDAVLIEPALPHGRLPAFLLAADALLLVVPDIPGARAWVPGKIFEYLASGRPVLAVVPPEGEAASLVASHGGGIVVRPGDPVLVKRALEELISAHSSGERPHRERVHALSWSVLSQRFEGLVDSLAPKRDRAPLEKRPRVALASSGLGIVERGVETFTHELGKALQATCDVTVFGGGGRAGSHRRIPCAARNNPVTIALYRASPEGLRRAARRLHLDPLGAERLTFSLGLLAVLLVKRYDVLIESDGFWGGLFSRLARRMTGVRVISVGHGGLGGALEEVGQSTDCYVNVNSTIVGELAQRYAAKRIRSLPLFVDVSRYKPAPSPLALPLERPVFITVGALEEEKRIDLAVKALAALGRGSLLVVGGGGFEERLLSLGMRELGQKRFCIRCVPAEAMVHYYNFADVFTLPSAREAFSLSMLEAMACDLPVVTVVEGTRAIFGNGCIVPCDPEDAAGYAAALEKALDLAGSGRSRERALRYSREAVGRDWCRLVMEVSGR